MFSILNIFLLAVLCQLYSAQHNWDRHTEQYGGDRVDGYEHGKGYNPGEYTGQNHGYETKHNNNGHGVDTHGSNNGQGTDFHGRLSTSSAPVTEEKVNSIGKAKIFNFVEN